MYLKSLKNKNVIITGCNKGIGKSTLEGFAKYGANIFACVRSDSKEFKKFTSSLKKKYKVKIYIIKLDLLKKTSISTYVYTDVYVYVYTDVAGTSKTTVTTTLTPHRK